MKIAFITDEVTQNFDEVIAFALKNQLDAIELRSIANLPIDELDDTTLQEFKTTLDAHGISVCNLASSFYKCNAKDKDAICKNLQKLNRLCDIADILDCNTIRGFTFFKTGDLETALGGILENFEPVKKILQIRNKILLLEADPSVNTTNHRQLAQVIAALNCSQIRAIYDPGNDLYDPEKEIPFPDGYEVIQPFLAHIHIKDAVIENGEAQCVKVGTGWVDYKALLNRLINDGYNGYLSMETHYRINKTISEELMRLPGGEAFTDGGREATAESILSLKKLLEETHIH